ncbi:phenylacetyl-CoA ligase [Laetiporus sulphureus 93-53]|uniref:Phenylacetyl-CoA ligase n=1 Tax=Laetiporus sulphureus 93-53 TaxID=1314785 RepID=A0A165BF91_9APHY|nr:phenylacetyl-CoA ligase [Laetiporus sulphureus 93-53]KZT00929.1 phenylacetyl-CoA ligase [Laetiporus sulphureus 93-53]
MTIFHSNAPPLVPPPDDLTLPQVMLDYRGGHPTRPVRPRDIPWFVDEENGRMVFEEEVRARTDAFARAMRHGWGIGKDDVVAICSPNQIDYPISVWATHRLGAAVAMMGPSLTTSELVYQLKLAEPALIIAHGENISTVLEAAFQYGLAQDRVIVLDAHKSHSPVSCKSVSALIDEGHLLPSVPEFTLAPGEGKTKIAALCFSSGTTGNPKAVAVSHYNIISNILQTATTNRVNEDYAPWEDRRYRPGDRSVAVLPIYHIYGLVAVWHFALYVGLSVVVVQKFNYEGLLQAIQRYKVTHLFIVPPQVVLFCKHPATKKYDLSSVRVVMVAAAPLSGELTAQMLKLMPGIHMGQGYGLTETCAAVSLWPVSSKVGTPGSAGQLISGTIAKVVRPDGTLAGVGEPGELWLKGGQITLGYHRNEQATRECFVDGWFKSGDEVIMQENGDLFITDRIKELIKVKGYQVAPAELEGHLLDHPHVADAGVIGLPDEYSGELPLAFVVLQPHIAPKAQADGAVAAEIRSSIFKHVAEAKSEYKWLTGGIVFIDAIPKNPSGKILRRLLRERAKAMIAPARSRL